MRKKISIILLSLCILTCTQVLSQKAPPTPPPAGKPSGPPALPGLPIDSGLSYLIVSGLFYGVYEIRKRRKS